MTRKSEEQGSTAVAFTLATIPGNLHRRNGLPLSGQDLVVSAGDHEFGAQIDAQFDRTLLITGVVFVAAQIGLAYAIFKFRDHGQKATYFEGNNHDGDRLDAGDGGLVRRPGLVCAERLGGGALSWAPLPARSRLKSPGSSSSWNFRYAGPDGKFGREKPELVSASTGNPVGLDPTDPASKDDIVSPVMPFRRGAKSSSFIRSQDVTHSFFVRELRLKQDAVPGMEIHMHFTAHGARRLRDGLRGTLRAGTLPHAQHADGDVRAGFRKVDEGSGSGEPVVRRYRQSGLDFPAASETAA